MSAPLTLEQVIMTIRDIYGDDCADFSKAVYNGYHNKMTGVKANFTRSFFLSYVIIHQRIF